MLNEFARMSQIIGARRDYVQGGGGNTSVKLGDNLMAIKASGYKLSGVTENDGFAVVEVDSLRDVTEEQGFKPLRPSVEVGFHALLGKYVLHTHPVYANLALCSQGGVDNLPTIMADIPYIIVPYINPGEELSAAIKERLKPNVQVVFMVNHGLIVSAESADECLQLHENINKRIALAYDIEQNDFINFEREIVKTLYPDQQVYLTLTETQQEVLTAVMFIQFTLMRTGNKALDMDKAAVEFLANWESEDYRKSVLK